MKVKQLFVLTHSHLFTVWGPVTIKIRWWSNYMYPLDLTVSIRGNRQFVSPVCTVIFNYSCCIYKAIANIYNKFSLENIIFFKYLWREFLQIKVSVPSMFFIYHYQLHDCYVFGRPSPFLYSSLIWQFSFIITFKVGWSTTSICSLLSSVEKYICSLLGWEE
jgi:hypothetical protein